MRTKVVKWGNSLGLRIPKSIAEEILISDGTEIDLSLKDGCLIIKVVPQKNINLEDLLSGVTDENLHGEIDSGDPVGGESW